MKRTSLLLLFFISVPFYGQVLPDLQFADLYFTYGDGNVNFNAYSNNSQGKISYEVTSWKSDKDDSERGENSVIEEYYGYWYVMNAGEATVKATIAAWKDFSEHSVTANITVNKKQISVRVNNAERIYGTSNPPYEFTIISGEFAFKENVSTLNPAPDYYQEEKEADVNDGINPEQYPITFPSEPQWNYEFTVEPGYLTIKKADLLIAHKYPDGASYYMDEGENVFYYEKKYGDENPEFIADWVPVEGLKEWDIGKSIVTGNLEIVTGNTDRFTDCDTISLSLDDSRMSSKNYHVKLADDAKATLIIQPIPLTLVADNTTIEYGDVNDTNNSNNLTFTADWIKDADKDNFEQAPNLYIDALNTIDAGGPYTGLIKFHSVGAHKNYILDPESTINGDITIKKAPLTIYPKSYTTIYKSPVEIRSEIYIDRLKNDRDIEKFEDVYQLSRVNGNLFKSSTGTNFLQYDTGINVGTYDIVIDPILLNFHDTNYEIEIKKGSYEIEPATLTIDIDDINLFVRDSLPQLKYKIDVDHKLPYDPEELSYYLNSSPLRVDNFSANEPAIFDIFCDTIRLSNYINEIVGGKLIVHGYPIIDDYTETLKVCRDAAGRMGIKSQSIGRSYRWFIKIPEVDSFQVINQTIGDTLKLSGLATDSLQFDSVLVRYEDYSFKCKLTSTIKVYPDRDSLERAKETDSKSIGIEIKDTPPFASVIIKGVSILISGDPLAFSYKWYKTGDEAVLDSTQYLDIYGDESNAEQYYVITSYRNGCSTKSSVLTKGRDNGKTLYSSDSLVFSISPNPVRKGGVVKIDNLIKEGPYDIYIFNQMGEQKQLEKDIIGNNNSISLKLDEDKIEPGIYYLTMNYKNMYNSKVLLVSE
jgi:hypothetical protein